MPMRKVTIFLALTTAAALAAGLTAQGMRGGTRIGTNEECPPGTTEVRPGSCRAPSEPAPSILDYRPRSTLITAEHKVPKAKFPAIDVHGHPPSLSSQESINSVVAEMDRLNLRVMISADYSVCVPFVANIRACMDFSPTSAK